MGRQQTPNRVRLLPAGQPGIVTVEVGMYISIGAVLLIILIIILIIILL